MFDRVQPGDRIYADHIGELQDLAASIVGVSQGSGLEGFRDHRIHTTRAVEQRGIVVVRITADVYPEGSAEFVAAYGPFNPTTMLDDLFAAATTPIPQNAILQIRDPRPNGAGGPTGWADDPAMTTYYVTTNGNTPIPAGVILRIFYDRISNRWLPIGERQTEEIRLNSTTPDGTTGYYDAYIQNFDVDSQARSDGTRVWIDKLNSGDTLTLNNNYLGFLVGHKGGRCVYDIVVGGGGGDTSFWARLIGEPAGVSVTALPGGTYPVWSNWWYFLTYTFNDGTPDLVGYKGGLGSVATASGNGKLHVDPSAMASPPGGLPAHCSGWKMWMAFHGSCLSDQIYSLACDPFYEVASGDATFTATDINAYVACAPATPTAPPYSYSWIAQKDVQSASTPGTQTGGLQDDSSGHKGNAWGPNPAFEIAGSLQCFNGGTPGGYSNVIVRLYPGFNNSHAQVGQEYLFIGGFTGTQSPVVIVECVNNQTVYFYQTNGMNNGRIIYIC